MIPRFIMHGYIIYNFLIYSCTIMSGAVPIVLYQGNKMCINFIGLYVLLQF